MNIYQQYATLTAQIKELEAKRDQLKIQLMDEMGGAEITTEFGTFKPYYREKWQYSDEYTSKEKAVKAKLKAMQIAEQTSGKAIKLGDSGYPVFKPSKE